MGHDWLRRLRMSLGSSTDGRRALAVRHLGALRRAASLLPDRDPVIEAQIAKYERFVRENAPRDGL